MDAFVKGFIKAAVSWLTLGATLGLAMALEPQWTVYRTAHLHMLTLGFVAMMIFGVGYHVIPRIAGYPLVSGRLPYWHLWFSNLGLALMAGGFVLRVHMYAPGIALLGAGAALSALGAYSFAYVIWRTLDGPDTRRRIARRLQEDREQRLHLPVLHLVRDAGSEPAPTPVFGARGTARR